MISCPKLAARWLEMSLVASTNLRQKACSSAELVRRYASLPVAELKVFAHTLLPRYRPDVSRFESLHLNGVTVHDQTEQLHSELAAFISQRTLGAVSLPPELVAAVDAVSPTGGPMSARALRRHGQHLVAELRNNSRSTARGGRLDLSADPLEFTSGKMAHKKVCQS